jgi:glycosyltransferase involved in cell wall biosynthesis
LLIKKHGFLMKLLFTQDALVNAGAERSHLDILSRFSKEMDVGFVYFYPKHDLKEDYERAGIRLFFLDIPESYHFPLAISRLVKLIRREKPDLLVSSLWRADIITRIASVITGVPLIGTLVNDSYGPMAWKDKQDFKYKLVYWLDRLTARIPIHWIANAQALSDSHIKTLGLKREKISVVYRGRQVPFPPRSVPARPSGGSSQTETLPSRSVPARPSGGPVSPVGRPVSPVGGSSQTETQSPQTELSIKKTVSCEDTGHGDRKNIKKSVSCEDLSRRQADTGHGDCHLDKIRPRSVSSQTGIQSSQTEIDNEKSVSCEDLSRRQAGTGHGDCHGDKIRPRSVPARPSGGPVSPVGGSSQTETQSPQTETSPFHFISYGRLLERKGFQDAIQAFSEVLKTYPNCSLTIFGEGPYRKELEKLIQSLDLKDSVFLPGKIPNPIEVLLTGYFPKQGVTLSGVEGQLLTAHYFLFPSWYEGFSGALVEAMMAGIPIIASDIPMNLEAVKDQESALVFPVSNTKALEEMMIYAIENPDLMLELGNQARTVASQRFDIEVIAKEYEGVLKGVLSMVCASVCVFTDRNEFPSDRN